MSGLTVVKVDRRTIAVLIGLVAIPVLLAGPNLIASTYNDGPGGADIRTTRPDDGWRFIFTAARLARGAELGSSGAALREAERIWVSQPRAESVQLVYQDLAPFPVPVPDDGVTPRKRARNARPRSELNWIVMGRFGGREPQMIGMLDLHSGRVVWRLRRPVERQPA